MGNIANRFGKLEDQRSSKNGGGVIVMERWDESDDQAIEEAQMKADAQGKLLVVIQKFSKRDFLT
jgi:hypothetical protein